MTFIEIFNEEGDYVHDNCMEGFCFTVSNEGHLHQKYYCSKHDTNPNIYHSITLGKNDIMNKTYKKVLTRQSLFKN